MNHDLKTWPPFFDDVLTGAKTFELRRDDRGYAVGDVVTLREWAPDADYTGRTLTRSIGYIVRDAPHFGLAPGFAILGLTPTPKPPPTLDLPPAPEGMRWGRVHCGMVAHLMVVHPLPRGVGAATPNHHRACEPTVTVYSAIQTKWTAVTRACPTCVAIATKGAP